MKKLISVTLCFVLVFSSSNPSIGWGQIGHRAIGHIAEKYLTKKAKKSLNKVLAGESLAIGSVWMDEVKSDSDYDHWSPWHYCTIPDDMDYEQAGTPEEGDAIKTIERLISELKSKNFTDEDEVAAIRMLVHLVGDIHQPLHVGNGDDRGGNDIQVKWFGSNSNLHRVWDSQMIDGKQLSYTELALAVDNPSESELEEWQNDSLMDWINESKGLRNQVYDLPENKNLGYRYSYKNWETVERRILQAGIRLAAIFNSIYG